ncbi:MAG: hypothetical protein DRN24_05110, partial [Thermoplasmata archaeon]
MQKSLKNSKSLCIVIVISLLFSGILIPSTTGVNIENVKGFNKGPSFTAVVPMKKITFVNFDENSFLDDYAYLAAIPTTVFYDGSSRLFSYPLLFYQDLYPVKEDRERSLNARQGIDYFMEDWMSYSGGKLDQMTLVNVPKSKIPSTWDARDYVTINSDNPFDIASEIALQEWSYSDTAVVAVIKENFEKNINETVGFVEGTLPAYRIGEKEFKMDKPSIGIGGTYQSFEVTDRKYKYLVAQATWDNPGFDIDMQIYDDQLGMVSSNAESSWKKGIALEIGGSFVHDYGTWEIGLTAFPKKSITPIDGKMKNMFQIPSEKNTLGLFSKTNKNKANIKVLLYPGIEVKIDDIPSFGCRDAKFVLKWDDPDAHLGLTVVDPFGTEIASSYTKEEIIHGEFRENENEETVNVSMLGECIGDEKYSVYIYTLNDLMHPVDFTLEYSWTQNYPKEEGDSFTSAANGAVLASLLNAPLLYTTSSALADTSRNTLYKLGVKKIYVINIGGHLSKDAKNEIDAIGETVYYQEPEKIYRCIKNISNSYDIVFTTIEPWMQWYVGELKPSEEINDGALFVGPASYIAAHHGSPVFIVDEHPELSKAVVYHKDFWIKNAQFRTEPSAGDMIISGRKVYKFLDKLGFDKKANPVEEEKARETIITVAGQFNIGPTWDRTFVGEALPGRFHFSPVDTSYWITRSVFYPALVFENPGMQGKIKLINGSKSKISHLPLARLKKPFGVNLVITKPSQEEEFAYPVLQTYVSAAYKFNEQASKHWGTLYTRADGVVPYVQPSPDSIDMGATDKSGAYYPDLSDTEVIPFYCKKAGYESVFSTNFDKVVENLNRGVLIWVQDAHGYHHDGGRITFWSPESPYVYEENPWRAYEPIMLKPGHIRTFLHWLPYYLSQYGDILGLQESHIQFLKKISSIWLFRFSLFSERGSTENPDVALFNPHLAGISRVINKLSGGYFEILGAFGFMIHWDRLFYNPDKLPLVTTYDGMVTTSTISGSGLTERSVTGPEFDDALKNLHSAGINTVVCFPAGTYLQMTWVRHGASYIIMDPWSTSDYCAVWLQSIIKNLALGDTIGQAYEKGIRACGPEYLTNQWWWDTLENVCFYGDPDLRVFVPGTEFSDK